MKKYIQFLKDHEGFDKYVLFLLSLSFSISDIAKMTELSRPAIYAVIERNKKIVQEYIDSLEEIL